MEELTPTEALMAEIAANLATLTEHTMEQVSQPPRGTISEIGHFRALNERLKRKEMDALQRLLDDLAYNVAATIFATLDGSIESEQPGIPKVALINRETGEPLTDDLHAAFAAIWNEEAEE